MGLSEYSLLVLKLATKIQRIISLWKWNEVLPKLLEHMLLTPQHYVGTMYLLCHLLSGICIPPTVFQLIQPQTFTLKSRRLTGAAS